MNEVEEYILALQGNQREMMLFLHDWISKMDAVRPKISYRIPFYYRNRWLAYLNPLKGDKIELCFCRGHELKDEGGLLDDKGRKIIKGIELVSLDTIPLKGIEEVFKEAIALDETIPKKR